MEGRVQRVIGLVAFFHSLSLALVTPALPRLAGSLREEDPVATTALHGLGGTIHGTTELIAAPILGALSDAHGRRSILCLILTGTLVSYVLCAMTRSVEFLLVARCLAGATGCVMNICLSCVADTQTRENTNLSGVFGAVGAWVAAGQVVGPLLAEAMESSGGTDPHLPFAMAVLVEVMNMITVLVLLPETHGPQARKPFDWKRGNMISSFVVLFASRDPTVTLVATVLFLDHVALHGVRSVWVVFTQQCLSWSRRILRVWVIFLALLMFLAKGHFLRRALRWRSETDLLQLILLASCSKYVLYGLSSVLDVSWLPVVAALVGSAEFAVGPLVAAALTWRLGSRYGHGTIQAALGGLRTSTRSIGSFLFAIACTVDVRQTQWVPVPCGVAIFVLATLLNGLAYRLARRCTDLKKTTVP